MYIFIIYRELFGTEDFSLKLDEPDPTPQAPVKKEPTTPTDPNAGFTPNLAKFMTKTNSDKSKQRPDSSLSISSTNTTSYSHSISEADSGLGDIGSLASSSSTQSFKRPLEAALPRLDQRSESFCPFKSKEFLISLQVWNWFEGRKSGNAFQTNKENGQGQAFAHGKRNGFA